ncbi:Hypothetical_protein [Hexamita inflata]|uniref:Hypothetical_protein n=1 Tax=Hexamita inflata TaxID=28002 RepID=A0ABP1HRT2_9EUKA
MDLINCTTVPELSVILYSSNDKYGLTTKFVYAIHGIPNQFDITHAGIIIHASADELIQMVDSGLFPNLQQQHIAYFKTQLIYQDNIIRPYILQSDMPIVFLRPLDTEIEIFEGPMWIRTPKINQISYQQFEWKDLIGKMYEKNWLNMIWSIYKIKYRNNQNFTFCSKLVAQICVRSGLIKTDWTTISPERLSSTDDSNDVLICSHNKVKQLKVIQLSPDTPCNSQQQSTIQNIDQSYSNEDHVVEIQDKIPK